MPAGLPGDSYADAFGNPNEGNFVIMDALSGPKDSPFDGDIDPVTGDPTTISTGALSTGIGFGSPPILNASQIAGGGANFDDDYTLGVSSPDSATPFADSTGVYIGGGRSLATVDGFCENDPYTAGFGIVGAGNGGSRDSGANTGFGVKSVTATGAVANGAAVEAGWVNRSGLALVSGDSVFGSAVVANAAPA